MTESHRSQEPMPGEHLAYAPRFGIELMNECDHAVVAAALKPPVKRSPARDAEASDCCIRCSRCSRMVDVRFWRPESGEWYLRLRDRFAAGHMSIFRYAGDTWVTDG